MYIISDKIIMSINDNDYSIIFIKKNLVTLSLTKNNYVDELNMIQSLMMKYYKIINTYLIIKLKLMINSEYL